MLRQDAADDACQQLLSAGSTKLIALQAPADVMELPSIIKLLYHKEWVVDARLPFGGPAQVAEYLGRYTHKVAISNQRLIKIENGQVHFNYKDYRNGAAIKQMSLSGEEFIRRWLQHVLPPRFVKIRHYGFLSNRDKTKKLKHIAQQMNHTLMPPVLSLVCPHCKQGTMMLVKTWERGRSP
ncbi:MAG: transposase [Chitinophagales bacterium]